MFGDAKRLKQPFRRVEHAIGVVCRELALVRPRIPELAEFARVAALGLPQPLSPDLLPGVLHALQEEHQIACVRLSGSTAIS
jgi:hypothetical protein